MDLRAKSHPARLVFVLTKGDRFLSSRSVLDRVRLGLDVV